nr:IS66 family insertion sequence element accessory protein TnpB [Eubacterium sp.]
NKETFKGAHEVFKYLGKYTHRIAISNRRIESVDDDNVTFMAKDYKDDSIYLFCGKRCDRIKVLLLEPDGYVLLYKRLNVEQGRYRWPRNRSEVQPITWQQSDWLMSSLEIEQPKAIKISEKP